jgi:hypothetical protein
MKIPGITLKKLNTILTLSYMAPVQGFKSME